jgi:release factor glutamine methyltransferase
MTGDAEEQRLYDELLCDIARGWTPLADKADESPELTLRCLWFAAVGVPRSCAASERGELPPLSSADAERLRQLVQRRVTGEPVAYIVGRQRFMGLEMLCAGDALIPRAETELLASVAIHFLGALRDPHRQSTVIDVCTGSGNLALAIAAHEPTARVFACDISPGAVALARANAVHLGLSDRVTFAEGDLLAPLEAYSLFGAVDLMVCNPPYISSGRVAALPGEIARYEPHLAFDGGLTGMRVISRLISDAPRYLRPGGRLCFEVGAANGALIADRVRRHSVFDLVETTADSHGTARVVNARRSDAVA